MTVWYHPELDEIGILHGVVFELRHIMFEGVNEQHLQHARWYLIGEL